MFNFSRWKWMLLALACCLVIFVVNSFLYWHGGPDVELYYKYATQMGDGLVPYRDFSVEYPPVALGLFYVPYLLTHDLGGFNTAFAVEMTLFSMVGVWLVLGLARQLRTSPLAVLLCYTLITLAVGSIVVWRFDMAPAVITLAAVYAFCRGKHKIAWIVLAIGVVTKVYPLVLAPLFCIYQWQRSGWRRLLPSLVLFALMLLLIAGPALKLGGGGFIGSFTVQSSRSLQLESSYSSLLLLLGSLGLVNAAAVQGPSSFDISSPLSGFLSNSSFVVVGVGLAAIYLLFYLRNKHDLIKSSQTELNTEATAGIINYSTAAIAAFIITNKVFSPQFMVWLCPVVPLFYGRWRKTGLIVFLLAICLTWYVYPMNYFELADDWQVVVDALVIRNALIILLVVLLLARPSYPVASLAETPMLASNTD